MESALAWDYWEDKATELKRTILTRAAESAKGWIGFTSTLLGVFGVATIVAGPASVDKVPAGIFGIELPVLYGVVVLSILAVSSAVVGLIRLSKVGHAIPAKLGWTALG